MRFRVRTIRDAVEFLQGLTTQKAATINFMGFNLPKGSQLTKVDTVKERVGGWRIMSPQCGTA